MQNELFPDIVDEPDLIDPDQIDNQEQDNEIPPQPGDSEDNYDFKTGNLDDFMHSFQEHKEDMPIDERPTPEEFAEAGKQVIPPNTARATGKFVARMIDFSASMGLSMLSGEPRESHKAQEEDLKELMSISTELIKESGGEIPTSVQLIIFCFVTYGLQLPGAYMKFKKRKAIEENGQDS